MRITGGILERPWPWSWWLGSWTHIMGSLYIHLDNCQMIIGTLRNDLEALQFWNFDQAESLILDAVNDAPGPSRRLLPRILQCNLMGRSTRIASLQGIACMQCFGNLLQLLQEQTGVSGPAPLGPAKLGAWLLGFFHGVAQCHVYSLIFWRGRW